MPNAAARRIVVATTAAALAPSRDTPRRGLLAGSIGLVPPAAAAARQQTTYRLFATALARQSSTAKRNERRIPRLLGRSSIGPSFSFPRVSEPGRSSSAFRCNREGPSTLEFRSSRAENRNRPRARRGAPRVRGDEDTPRLDGEKGAGSMIYHKPTTPRFRIAERVCAQPSNNRPTYNKQNSHSSTCSLRSVGSTPPCISR